MGFRDYPRAPTQFFLGLLWSLLGPLCKIMAFMAVIMGLGQLFYIPLGSR